MQYVRVKPPVCAVRHPEHGELVVPNPAQAYRVDDPLVVAYPWLFESDADHAEEAVATEVRIEQATRAPGERRPGRRR